MNQEKKANEALQFQNDHLKKLFEKSRRKIKKQDVAEDNLKIALIDKTYDLKDKKTDLKKQSKTIKSFDRDLASIEKAVDFGRKCMD